MREFGLLFHVGPDGMRGYQAAPTDTDGWQFAALNQPPHRSDRDGPQLPGGLIEGPQQGHVTPSSRSTIKGQNDTMRNWEGIHSPVSLDTQPPPGQRRGFRPGEG
jgi:hypothetical protein